MSIQANLVLPNQTLFHVTHRDKMTSITSHGIDPRKSRSAQAVSWFCTWLRLMWAIPHVADNHNWYVGELVVFSIKPSAMFKRTKWDGVYVSNFVVQYTKMVYAHTVLEEFQARMESPYFRDIKRG